MDTNLCAKTLKELQDIFVDLSVQLEGCTPSEAWDYLKHNNYTNKDQLLIEIDFMLEMLEK